MAETITRENFKAFAMDVFAKIESRLLDGWDREMLEREFAAREIDLILPMHEAGYTLGEPEHDIQRDTKDDDIGFWMDLYDQWLEWEPYEAAIVNETHPKPGMWVQRRGDKPTRVVKYHPAGTFRVMPGDEKHGWLTTEDGSTSCDGTYRVLGYRDGEG